MSEDFSEIVKINRFKLPEECQKHAGLYHQIAEQEAMLKDKLNWAKDAYELTLSEKDTLYRQSWDEEKWGKITETSIKNKINMDEEVRKAKGKMFDIMHDYDVVIAARNAMEHRKSMLNNLVSLLIGGFYAAPEGAKQEGKVSSSERDLRKRLNEEDEE